MKMNPFNDPLFIEWKNKSELNGFNIFAAEFESKKYVGNLESLILGRAPGVPKLWQLTPSNVGPPTPSNIGPPHPPMLDPSNIGTHHPPTLGPLTF